jgi:phosphatidylinositol-4-phosphate 3-kinase
MTKITIHTQNLRLYIHDPHYIHDLFQFQIEYRLPLDIIRQKTLQVSVWHYDPLQENNFLGGVSIPLATLTADREIVGTYLLGNINSAT